jgi:hypothetical protein
MFNLGVKISESINLAPDTPKAIIDAYVAASRKIFEDPEFEKIKQKQVGAYEVVYGKAADKWLVDVVRMKPEARKWLADFLKTNYHGPPVTYTGGRRPDGRKLPRAGEAPPGNTSA